MPMAEILTVLADEIDAARAPMSAALADFASAADDAGRAQAAERYLEEARRIGRAGEVLGLEGVAGLHKVIEHNVQALLVHPSVTPEIQALSERWPVLLRDYLCAPQNADIAHKLAFMFADPGCPAPISTDSAEALQAILLEVSLEQMAEADGPARATEATSVDVALDVPDDVNPELLEAFLAEGPLQAAHYSATLRRVIQGEAGIEALNEARRVVHAIKGAANTVGVRGVANLTHHLEDILEAMGENAFRAEGVLAKLLMDAADCLEMMFETLVEGKNPPPQSLSVLQQILGCANRMDRGEFDFASDTAGAPIAPAPLPARPAADQTAPAAAAPLTPKLRVAASTIDGMLRLSGEMTISRAHIQERLNRALKQLHDLRENHALLWRRGGEIESLVTIQGVAAGEKRDTRAPDGAPAAGIFDALEMDQYSELHGGVHALVETAADLQVLGSSLLDTLSALTTAVTQQGLINNELHETIMGSRMVAASVLEPRLARTLRQACEATGKRASLALEGGDVPLDDQMLNLLVDPIAHLLRNAVDHGLESPDLRAAAGKPETGRVTLRFARAGSFIVIECADDGAGLDLGLIHGTAVARGLIEEHREIKDEDIARLILLPGFSTKAEVSQVSGRGVGMDIVHNALTKLKGEIDIKTEPGRGCRFVLRVPMSLGSVHCLLARVGDDIVALPSENVERVVHAGAALIQRAGREWMFRDELDACTAYDLSDLLGYSAEDSLGGANDQRPVVLLRDAKDKAAIVLDKLLGGRDFVIKGLGRYLSGLRGAVGASLTGDGRVLPVLDVGALLRRRRGIADNVVPLVPRTDKAAARAVDAPDILVVDDSLSVRTSLTGFLNSEGYATRTARDGVEALEEIDKRKPAALLVDLEMPRLNGLELTARLRARPDVQALPIIMITSRAAEKHRTQAQLAGVDVYITKPYREADLLARLGGLLTKAA
jgi:chemosensory pili system protein ChpA (sensor histidine kinase/response regulator)